MKKLLFMIACVLVLMPLVAKAADFRAVSDGTVSVTSQDNVKNLYAAANTVSTDGIIKGDAVLAGSAVNAKGDVKQSLFAAAGNISVTGNIGQNVRLAGGNITVSSANIGQDFLAASGTFYIDKNTIISGDLIVAAGTVDLLGKVQGDVRVTAGQVTINGLVDGDVIAKNLDTLTIGDGAVIKGNIKYSAKNQANISSKASVAGTIEFTPVQKSTWAAGKLKSVLSVTMVLMLASSYLLLLALIYILPKFVHPLVQRAYKDVVINIGLGLMVALAVPAVLILLLVSVLGLKIAFMLGLSYIFIMVLGKTMGAIVLGAGVYKLFSKKEVEYKVDWLTALIGVVLVAVLAIIPFIGWLVIFVFYMMALGALVRWVGSWVGRNR